MAIWPISFGRRRDSFACLSVPASAAMNRLTWQLLPDTTSHSPLWSSSLSLPSLLLCCISPLRLHGTGTECPGLSYSHSSLLFVQTTRSSIVHTFIIYMSHCKFPLPQLCLQSLSRGSETVIFFASIFTLLYPSIMSQSFRVSRPLKHAVERSRAQMSYFPLLPQTVLSQYYSDPHGCLTSLTNVAIISTTCPFRRSQTRDC